MTMRINKGHRHLPPVDRGEPFSILVDGRLLSAYPGETIAAVMIAHGRYPASGAHAGYFCGIGVCHGCVVQVDGLPRRACMITAAAEMRVETGTENEG